MLFVEALFRDRGGVVLKLFRDRGGGFCEMLFDLVICSSFFVSKICVLVWFWSHLMGFLEL